METLQARSIALDATRSLRRVLEPEVISAVLVFAVVVPLATGNGGFSPVAWGWGGIGLAWAGLMALLLRGEIHLTRLDIGWMVGWLALTAWTALGLVWTVDTSHTVLEVERMLMYLAAAWTFVVAGRGRSVMGIVFGVWSAITIVAAYSLATHLLPLRFGIYNDPIQPGRLYQPLGYWNGLGIFACMGALLAVGIADHRGRLAGRALAAASVPPLVLTMYFTFSRGAWVAAAAAIVVVTLIAPHRLRYLLTLIVMALCTAAPLIVGAHSSALSASPPNPAAAEHAGAHVLLILAGASLACAVAVFGLAKAQDRISAPTWARRVFAGALVCAVLAGAGAVTVKYGSPATLIHRVDSALRVTTPPTTTNLSTRLFSLSLNGRGDTWRVALHEFRQHPATGTGAGTFTAYWFQRRPYSLYVLDAHSLYIEAAGETGAVGLALLLVVLAIPLVAGVRARRHMAVPAALGAYVAFLVHAGFDWDWELPAVTVVGLAAGAMLLLAAHGVRSRSSLRGPAQWLLAVGFVGIAALSLGGLLANRAVSDAESALNLSQWQTALTDAKTAERYAPWSEQPHLIAGSAQQGLGNHTAAAAEFRRAIAKSPRDWDAWNSLAATTTGQEHLAAVRMLHLLNPLAGTSAGAP